MVKGATHSFKSRRKRFLIGNKIDLEATRKVDTVQGEQYAEENNINMFMETSAKTGLNAQKVFIEAAKLLYNDYLKYQNKTGRQKAKTAAQTENKPTGLDKDKDSQHLSKKQIDKIEESKCSC